MNVLLCSVGTRNLIVRYFKENIDGRVIATDMQPIAPAIYEADAYYIVPRITDSRYIDIIVDICKKENVRGILSLIDPELSLLAKNSDRFKEIGVTVIGSSYELCEMSLNKMQMYRWLSSHNYSCARSYDSLELFKDALAAGLISFPVFVKPICGSASLSIRKITDMQALETVFQNSKDLMIQEYLDGQEIGADVYIDMISHDVVSVFTKKKLLMKAGETDKALSFKDEKLFSLIESFVKETGFSGQIDIDIFDVNGEYYISEVNPRFGGGYPHAYCCGVNHMKLISNNLNGIPNVKSIGCYEDGIVMMKYQEVSTRKL